VRGLDTMRFGPAQLTLKAGQPVQLTSRTPARPSTISRSRATRASRRWCRRSHTARPAAWPTSPSNGQAPIPSCATSRGTRWPVCAAPSSPNSREARGALPLVMAGRQPQPRRPGSSARVSHSRARPREAWNQRGRSERNEAGLAPAAQDGQANRQCVTGAGRDAGDDDGRYASGLGAVTPKARPIVASRMPTKRAAARRLHVPNSARGAVASAHGAVKHFGHSDSARACAWPDRLNDHQDRCQRRRLHWAPARLLPRPSYRSLQGSSFLRAKESPQDLLARGALRRREVVQRDGVHASLARRRPMNCQRASGGKKLR
jgi:hypothetical protein